MSESTEAWRALLKSLREFELATGKIPVVLGMEIYEYFGEVCKVIEVNNYSGDFANPEVTICSCWEKIVTVDFDELTLR